MKKTLHLILFSFLIAASAKAAPVTTTELKTADAAFSQRSNQAKANEALSLYREQFARSPENFETGWRLAMGCYFVGNRFVKDESAKEKIFEEGRDAGLKSIELNPNCAACHFWTAINMALYGETKGAFKMLGLISTIEKHLENSLKIDPKYAYAGAYRLLGIIQQKLPGIVGGSDTKAREFFEKAIETSKDEPLNYLMLATLYKENLDEPKKAVEIAKQGLNLAKPSPDRVESLEAYEELARLVPILLSQNQ